jgi:general secretion pathway protein J
MHPRRRPRRALQSHVRRSAGFTLVEVLVALMIMAVIATMAWQGVDAIVRSRDIAERQLQHSLRLNTIMAQWQQDLAAVQDTPAVPALSFDGASIRLTRRTAEGMQVVVWSLRSATLLQALPGEPAPEGMVWQRWGGPVVTRRNELQEQWLRSQQLQGNEPGQIRLLDGLAQWQVYFFRGREWSNAQSSGDRRPGTTFVPTSVELPSGVRIVVELAPGQPRQGRLTRDVSLGPQRR